jgi:uncharacterized SAM-binding protein YcdF (DUF218 family)
MRARITIWIAAAVATLLTWGSAAALLDVTGDRTPAGDSWDAVIVAGCRVLEDGTPSSCLQARAERGAQLVLDGHAPLLVLTGGIGAWPPSEAEAAAQVARDMGVPMQAIRVEDSSTSTEENALHASSLLGHEARVLVVTDAWHTHRVVRVFRRHFSHADAAGVDGTLSRRVRGSMREVLALVYYQARGRL